MPRRQTRRVSIIKRFQYGAQDYRPGDQVDDQRVGKFALRHGFGREIKASGRAPKTGAPVKLAGA